MDLDTALDGLELVERIAGDVAHTAPVIRTVLGFSLKGANTDTILAFTKAGKLDLAAIGEKFLDEEVKSALARARLLGLLTDRYTRLSLVFSKIEQDVTTVKFYDLLRKRSLYHRSRNARKEASDLKVDVWTKSTWARLGFSFKDGELVAETFEMGTGQHPLNSPSEETLATVVVRDDGPQCQDSSFPYSGGAAPSSTDSIFGNPFLGYNPVATDTTPIDNAVATSSNRVIKLAREALSLLKLEDKSARPGAA